MTVPEDEYYEVALSLIKAWEDASTQEYKDALLFEIADEDLSVIERLIQLAIKGLNAADDSTTT